MLGLISDVCCGIGKEWLMEGYAFTMLVVSNGGWGIFLVSDG